MFFHPQKIYRTPNCTGVCYSTKKGDNQVENIVSITGLASICKREKSVQLGWKELFRKRFLLFLEKFEHKNKAYPLYGISLKLLYLVISVSSKH